MPCQFTQKYLEEFSIGYVTISIQVINPEKEFKATIFRIPLKSTELGQSFYKFFEIDFTIKIWIKKSGICISLLMHHFKGESSLIWIKPKAHELDLEHSQLLNVILNVSHIEDHKVLP